MSLLMPVGAGKARAGVSDPASGGGGGGGGGGAKGGGGGGGKKKKIKKTKTKAKGKDGGSSLVVAALKRLLPVGLNLFAGKEQVKINHSRNH